MSQCAPPIHGSCTPKFASVRRVFERGFEEHPEIGASVCVFHRGEKVVDLWGGHSDAARRKPWGEGTQTVVFSATKGVAALAFLMLHARGLLDYDAPASEYWPELEGGGKEHMTVRTLLNHRGGLCALDAPLTRHDMSNRIKVHDALVAQTPLWSPDTAQGYHALTFGLYAAELFQRIAGKSMGTFIREEITGPVDAEFHLGVHDSNLDIAPIIPPSKKVVISKVLPAWLWGDSQEHRLYRAAFKKGTDTQRAFAHPIGLGYGGMTNYNLPEVQALELPWGNGVGNARGLATIYNALLAGRYCEPHLLDSIFERQSFEMDRVMHANMGWSQGFLKITTDIFTPKESGFGHPGTGGHLGWVAPDREVAFGYTMNSLDHRIRSPRSRALVHAAYSSAA